MQNTLTNKVGERAAEITRRIEALKGDLNAHKQGWITLASYEIREKKNAIGKLQAEIGKVV